VVLWKITSNVANVAIIAVAKTSKNFDVVLHQIKLLCNLVYIFVLPALLKQQGMGVKGAAKSAPVNEEIPPLLEGGGKLEVILSKKIK
jgi:hypothetical protein